MTTWQEIRDEVAGMLADGKPLEDVISKLDEMKNPKPMTNEEYLKSCNTEQLAEWISKATIDAWFRQVNNELPKPNGAKEWAEWLKQPHT